jgi:hypothetical protein
MNARRLISIVAASVLVLFPLSVPWSASAEGGSRHVHTVAVFAPVAGANFLNTIPGSKTLQYGTVKLQATSEIDGQPYVIASTAGLEYVNGSGPFRGAISFTAPNGDSLAFDYRGTAALNPDGSTTVLGSLRAFTGTGQFAHSTGAGSVMGTRAAGLPVGSPVTYVMDVDIRNGDRALPRASGELPDVEPPSQSVSVGLMGLPAERIVTANPDGRAFGIIRLTGPSTFQGVPVTVIDQASIAYSNGSGPFNGFITLLAADSSRVVMRFNGSTAAASDGGATVSGGLTVIAATGQWTGLQGKGILTGTRSGVVGSPLMAQAILSLHR